MAFIVTLLFFFLYLPYLSFLVYFAVIYNPKVALSSINLSIAYKDLGQFKQQKELLENILPTIEQHYGKDHLNTAIVLVNLSSAYGALGNIEQKIIETEGDKLFKLENKKDNNIDNIYSIDIIFSTLNWFPFGQFTKNLAVEG